MALRIRPARPILLLVLACVAATAGDEPPRRGPVVAAVETTLATRDHFTLVLDEPEGLKWAAAITGRPEGTDAVRSGTLEVSADGTTFRPLARFADGIARGVPADAPVRAIRIRPGPADRPIAIRELIIDADPPVSLFRYPVEFVVDTSDAPDLNAWAAATARACEHAYAMINDEPGNDGYRPPRRITLTIASESHGVSGMSGDRIVGSADHFRRRRGDDDGAIVHEMVHVAQGYRRGSRPSWLVEGSGGADPPAARIDPVVQINPGMKRQRTRER